MANKHHKIMIVGAGPGGIAVASDLIDAGYEDVVVLDCGVIGQSWLDYPPGTRLLSESSATVDDNMLAGIRVNDVIPNIPHPTHEMFQKYLREVVKRKEIKVFEQTTVSAVQKSGDQFAVTTDTSSYTCEYLIWATGMYMTPDEKMDSASCYIHYSRIQDWKHISDPEITIVGGANGATEVVLQLAAPGRKIKLITPRTYDAPTPVDCLWKENRQLVKQFEREGLVEIIENFRVKRIRHDDTHFIVERIDGATIDSLTRPIVCIGFIPNSTVVQDLVDTRHEDHDTVLELTQDHESKKTQKLFFAGTIGRIDPEHGFIRHFRDFGKSIVKRIGSYAID